MATKTADIQVLYRDENNEVVASQSAIGSTEDDGATIVIPHGYVPNIHEALASDILVRLQLPMENFNHSGLAGRVNDPENDTSTLTFNV